MVAAAVIDIPDLEATNAFGRRLGALLFAGAAVALAAQLGEGKTHLTRAIAEGVDVPKPRAVTSPTFVLIQEYPGRLPVYHFDAYRLSGPGEFLDLGVREYYEAGGVCVIEWADRVEPALPAEHLRIDIHPVDETRRRLVITEAGAEYERLVCALANADTHPTP